MYRTLQHMQIAGPQGGTIDLAPGDEIPGFDEWPPWTKHVMVDEKRVRWAPEGLSDFEKIHARPKFGSEYAATPGHTGRGGVAPLPAAPRPTEQIAQEATEALIEAVAKQSAEDMKAPIQAGELRCNTCNRIGFKDANGLKIHMARAHKSE